MTVTGSQLTVEQVHKLSRRPWLLVTGRLEGDPLNIGDAVTIHASGRSPVSTQIRSIEMHSAPGTTTIALDAELEESLEPGAVISR